jgi:hypothetical protein
MVQNYLLYRKLLDAYLSFALPCPLGMNFLELVLDLHGLLDVFFEVVRVLLKTRKLLLRVPLEMTYLCFLQKSVSSAHGQRTRNHKHIADHRLLFQLFRFKRFQHRFLCFPALLRQLSLIGTGQCLDITHD